MNMNFFGSIFVSLFGNKTFGLFFENMGPTGFDRTCNDVCKHAGSWDESLDR
jgi:hypothetical protein